MDSNLNTTSNMQNNLSNSLPIYKKSNLISINNIKWLKKQLWAWILFGIFVMSVFFYIAKGLIVFIGGIFLGMYMYNIYGKDNNEQTINNTLINNTMKYVKKGINNITKPEKIEGFQGYNIYSNF